MLNMVYIFVIAKSYHIAGNDYFSSAHDETAYMQRSALHREYPWINLIGDTPGGQLNFDQTSNMRLFV